MKIKTTNGQDTDVDPGTVEQLSSSVRGNILQKGDVGYDEARDIWNAMIDRKPALIIRCSGVADVSQAVKFAATRDLLTAIRGGGHNIAGSALAEGGVVIDLSNLKPVHVDPSSRRAYVSPGATLGGLAKGSTTSLSPGEHSRQGSCDLCDV